MFFLDRDLNECAMKTYIISRLMTFLINFQSMSKDRHRLNKIAQVKCSRLQCQQVVTLPIQIVVKLESDSELSPQKCTIHSTLLIKA